MRRVWSPGAHPRSRGENAQRRACQPPEPGAHPRSRGENWSRPSWSWSVKGSSPLTRGKYSGGLASLRSRGLIPAHAGKIQALDRKAPLAAAHPRSRGENASDAERNESTQGSSPLTRGKLSLGMSDSVDKRLIPAHAGKIGTGHASRVARWAHPRSRGENTRRPAFRSPAKGSSPLTRGKYFCRSSPVEWCNRFVSFGLGYALSWSGVSSCWVGWGVSRDLVRMSRLR